MYGIIYCTTNLKNGKKYIGKMVFQYNSKDRAYLGSGIRLVRAIKKYGRENFIRETLCECNNRADLNEMEKYYIGYYNAINSDLFYNLASGGEGGNLAKYKNFKKIARYALDGKFIDSFENAKEVERKLINYNHKSVLRSCWRIKNKYKDYIFRFYDETLGNDIAAYRSTQGDYLATKVLQLTQTGEILESFRSISEAYRLTQINNISACVRGVQKSAGGYLWRYAA